jgi:RNA polymerase sigma-70 factor (ECF subfamily)
VDYTALSPVDLALTCLRTGDESAWVEFIRRFQPLIAGVVIRIARGWGETSPEVFDDLIQDTYLKLCTDRGTLLERFHPNHPNSIFGYIKVFTANVVHDHFKALHSQKRGSGIKAEPSGNPDQNTDLISSISDTKSDAKSIERTVLIGEIDAYLRRIGSGRDGERDRRVFWLYYRVGLTATAIAGIPSTGLTTKGVESALLRLTKRVKLLILQESTSASAAPKKGIQPTESL